jgi:hypothetical protein
MVLYDGEHFKIEVDKRQYDENKVEIIHVTHKSKGFRLECYSSNYAVQFDEGSVEIRKMT